MFQAALFFDGLIWPPRLVIVGCALYVVAVAVASRIGAGG